MTIEWVYDRESFSDFLGFVIEYAPDFPEEDFLDAREQLDLDKAFEQLAIGLELIGSEISISSKVHCQRLLSMALQHFKNDDEFGGARILQDVETQLFK